MEETPYWIYRPALLEDRDVNKLYGEVNPYCGLDAPVLKNGRRSFVVMDKKIDIYPQLHRMSWDELPELNNIKEYINKNFNINPDYCLVHIYPDRDHRLAQR